MNKKTVKDIEVKGKKVLVRCDFNVPMKDGVITDDNRIIGALPTIQYLMVGSAPIIRFSSVMTPSFMGTLKSHLTKTFLPLTSMSFTVFLFIDKNSPFKIFFAYVYIIPKIFPFVNFLRK